VFIHNNSRDNTKSKEKLYMSKYLTRWRVIGCAFILVVLAQAIVPLLLPRASAGTLTYSLVRFDRMKASTATTGTVCAKPASTATETSVKVTFPTSYTVNGTVGNWAVSTAATTGWPKDPLNDSTAATAWPGISAPTGAGEFVISGQAVNFVSGDLAVGTWYCFNWTNTAALTTKSSASADNSGTVITQTTGGVASDSDTYATATVANDQIGVTATIGPTFNFLLSSNTAALGTLTSANPVAATPINATINTNAPKGWNIWASDPAGTPGLTSTTASKTIAYNPTVGSAAATLSNGAEGYNMGAGTATGTTCTSVTDDAAFASSGTSYKGGGLDGTLRMVAVSTGIANACALPLTVNASISATTPPATDYAGTITVVAAGRF
jgi:hypothetical protein